METSDKYRYGVTLLIEDNRNHVNDSVVSKKFENPSKAYAYAQKLYQQSIVPYLQDCFTPSRGHIRRTLRVLFYTELSCLELATFQICA